MNIETKLNSTPSSIRHECETEFPSTLVASSLTTLASLAQPEAAKEDAHHQHLWRCLPEYTWSQRARDTPSWVWGFSFDIQKPDRSRRWVCQRCIRNKNPRPKNFAEKGIQNAANDHLFKDHRICALSGTKSAAQKKAERLRDKDQRSIADVMKLDTSVLEERDIAKSLIRGYRHRDTAFSSSTEALLTGRPPNKLLSPLHPRKSNCTPYSQLPGRKQALLCLTQELGLQLKGLETLYCSNQRTITLLTDPPVKLQTNLRHVDIHRHWLRQEVQEGRLQFYWVQFSENPADGMTKAFPVEAHRRLRSLVGVLPLSEAGSE